MAFAGLLLTFSGEIERPGGKAKLFPSTYLCAARPKSNCFIDPLNPSWDPTTLDICSIIGIHFHSKVEAYFILICT